MSWFSFFLSLSFLYITIVSINQSSSAVTNNQKKLKSDKSLSLLDGILPMTDQIEQNINELRCPEEWSQLGYSCYLLSDYMATAIQANHTCDLLHLKNSRLMYIQQSVQLMFAAHVLIKNSLYSLMFEVDQNLMQGGKIVDVLSSEDHVQWEKFRKKIVEDKLKDQKEKRQSSKPLLRRHENSDDNTVDRETPIVINDIKNNENEDQNKFKNVDYIRKPCDKIKWNVNDEKSNILIITIEMDSNESICLLSNANIKAAYSHLCQYMLDRCHNNIICGTHGRCINSLSGFNCSCSFLYDGLFCEKLSSKDIQLLIAPVILLMGSLYLISWTRDLLRRALKWLFCCCCRRQATSTSSKDNQNKDVDNNQPLTHSNLLFNDNIYTNGRNINFRIENLILLIISIVLTVIFSFLNTQGQSNDDNQSRIIEPIKPFYITDRYKTVAIIMIQMFEILQILDETLVDISEASQSGIFFKIFTRLLFVIINAFRYYPVLASLHFQDIKVRCLTLIYLISMIVFMIIRDNSHIYWLSFSKKAASLERVNLHMDMSLWLFVYSFAKNCVYWILIGYIGAELTMRFFYDSIYVAFTNERKTTDRKIQQYAFSAQHMEKICLENSKEHVTTGGNNEAKSDNAKEQGCWLNIQKFFSDHYRQFQSFITNICKGEDNFRFTTIVIATYTIAFIFLFHLTFTLIFLYTTEKTNYITYPKQILERLLNIEIKEQSFKREVIFSAIITMIIYGLQLLHSIKNYKDNMIKLYNIYSTRRRPHDKPKDDEIIPKSVQYPAFILRYLLGGFVICFNLILFTMIMSKATGTRTTSFKWTLIPVLSVIFVYGLHKMINLIINSLFTSYNPQGHSGLRLNRPYSILLYFNLVSTTFIGIISSIIRLITSVLVNILFMPRIDYSCFVPPLEKLDSAHMSFQCFIHWEFLYTRDILLRFSNTTQMALDRDLVDKETTAVEDEENEYMDPDNNEENIPQSYSVNEIPNDYGSTRTSSQSRLPRNISSTRAHHLMPRPPVSETDGELAHALLLNPV